VAYFYSLAVDCGSEAAASACNSISANTRGADTSFVAAPAQGFAPAYGPADASAGGDSSSG